MLGSKRNPEPSVVRAVKEWAREALGLGPDSILTANELRCLEDGCPEVETVIGVPGCGLPPLKISKPMADVSRDDIEAAIGRPKGR